MNLYWNDEEVLTNFKHNCELFTRRFKDLAKQIGLVDEKGSLENCQLLLNKIPENYSLQTCKKNVDAKTVSVNGRYLHSRYDSVREAKQLLDNDFFKDAALQKKCLFLGLGLGYVPEFFIAENSDSTIILVEPDIYSFLIFLSAGNLDILLAHENLIILPGLDPPAVFNFLLNTNNKKIPRFNNKAIQQSSPEWYTEFETILKRNSLKDSINANTAQKFSKLWLRNICKNVDAISAMRGIYVLKNAFQNGIAIVIAAGPTLDKQLAILSKLKASKECDLKNFIIIAVDTALKACRKFGITPDFLITGDPQFWNFLHIAGFDMLETVLITEITVFPQALRLKTKATFAYIHKNPLNEYYKTLNPEIEVLESGGSIATTAWSFAKFLGVKKIVMLGLDLAYPKKQTHFRGSTFEEKAHSMANRIIPAELASVGTLIAANPEFAKNYSGDSVLTDSRLKLYAWWFESTIAKNSDIKTYNFVSEGLKIPGIDFLQVAGLKQISKSVNISKSQIFEQFKFKTPKKPASKPIFFADIQTDLQYVRDIIAELSPNDADFAKKYSLLEEKPVFSMLEDGDILNLPKIAEICDNLQKILKKYL